MGARVWLVSYDVADDRVRYRLERLLVTYGERFQYSVFSCRLTMIGLRKLRQAVIAIIDAEVDSVRYYPLCDWCQASAGRDGVLLADAVPGYWIV